MIKSLREEYMLVSVADAECLLDIAPGEERSHRFTTMMITQRLHINQTNHQVLQVVQLSTLGLRRSPVDWVRPVQPSKEKQAQNPRHKEASKQSATECMRIGHSLRRLSHDTHIPLKPVPPT